MRGYQQPGPTGERVRPGLKGWARSRPGRVAVSTLAVPAALILLSGCAGKHNLAAGAGPADVVQPSATPTVTSSSATGNTGSGGSGSGPSGTASSPSIVRSSTQATKPTQGASSGTGRGCSAGAAVPKAAATVRTADLDADGSADTLWLGKVSGKRTLGVEMADGERFSTTFTSAGIQPAGAVAGRLGSGVAVILMETDHSVKLYAIIGCRIVATKNAQGNQYTFDEGVTGYGSGAGCPVIGSGRRLVGYLAKADAAGDSYTVTRTTINLLQGGARATNGVTTTLGTKVAPSATLVRTATKVSCGGGSVALEPAS
jgi:hypothetical protein